MRSRVFEEEAKGKDPGMCRGTRGDAVHSIISVAHKPVTVLDRKSIFELYYGDCAKEKNVLS